MTEGGADRGEKGLGGLAEKPMETDYSVKADNYGNQYVYVLVGKTRDNCYVHLLNSSYMQTRCSEKSLISQLFIQRCVSVPPA